MPTSNIGKAPDSSSTISRLPFELPPIALTMGDPAGIGPEITLKSWKQRAEAGLHAFCYIGDPALLRATARRLGIDARIETVAHIAEARQAFRVALPVLPIELPAPVEPGRPTAAAAPCIIAAIERGVSLVLSGDAAALVTNPIAKHVLKEAGFAHPGHTEFLGALAAAQGHEAHPVMMLTSPQLRAVPVTIHIALAAVPAALSQELITSVCEITAKGLQNDFGIPRPRLAVTGLNPHAGEAGAMGREEIDIIAPAIAHLKAKGLAVTGPHAADALFHESARRTYDVVIAMYHDQALIPLKTLGFDEGVNVTLGLPFIRTSPDHGTAFDIAGTGRARPGSLIQALRLARAMATTRLNRQRGSKA
jgi:4-hydroxythreonine-4-phosphate dehydrogenase